MVFHNSLLSNSSINLYTLSLVFRLGVDLVLPLSREEQEEEEPPAKSIRRKCTTDFKFGTDTKIKKIKTRCSAMDGRSPSLGWPPTTPRMVTHHPKSTRRKSTRVLKFNSQN